MMTQACMHRPARLTIDGMLVHTHVTLTLIAYCLALSITRQGGAQAYTVA